MVSVFPKRVESEVCDVVDVILQTSMMYLSFSLSLKFKLVYVNFSPLEGSRDNDELYILQTNANLIKIFFTYSVLK